MRRFPNGSVLYDDSPWFIEIVLFLLAIGLGAMAWVSTTQQPPHYLVAAVLGSFAVMCAAGMFAQGQHRTFHFDPSTSMMAWTTKGLFGRKSGEVAFQDMGVTLDTSSSTGSGVTYRVVLTTPSGSMPLSREYTGNRHAVEAQAASLRELLGQTPASLDDSVRQMVRSGNKIGAIAALRDQNDMSLEDAVAKADDQNS